MSIMHLTEMCSLSVNVLYTQLSPLHASRSHGRKSYVCPHAETIRAETLAWTKALFESLDCSIPYPLMVCPSRGTLYVFLPKYQTIAVL